MKKLIYGLILSGIVAAAFFVFNRSSGAQNKETVKESRSISGKQQQQQQQRQTGKSNRRNRQTASRLRPQLRNVPYSVQAGQ